MQTIAFEENLSQIIAGNRFEELTKILEQILFSAAPGQLMTHFRPKFAALVFQASSELDHLKRDDSKRVIISHLGLELAFNPGDLGKMITAVNSAEHCNNLRGNNEAFQLLCRLFLALSFLIRFHATVRELLVAPNRVTTAPTEAILEFEVVDVLNRGIGFDQFEAVLNCIRQIHDSVARGLEIESRLTIAYLDSGSNSIVSIKSDGKIVDGIRRLITDIWDRVRFGKYHKFERKLEAAEAGIAFVELIEQKEQEGKLAPDVAANLKHMAISETISLFGKGATLREIQIETTVDNRKLLMDQVDVKLLTAGSSAQGPEPSG